MVMEIFSSVTGRYDFLNRLLSLRRDVAWRRFTCRQLRFFETGRFLDVATGTADLAIEAALLNPEARAVGLDLVPGMMALGKVKIAGMDLSGRISLVRGDAVSLPFQESSYDTVAMAFGIRNIPDRLKALEEMKRVAVPGGKVMILEMSTPRSSFFRKLYSLYLDRILPRMAGLFTANPEAYIYLAESIKDFPPPAEFARLMMKAGLEKVTAHPLTMGITYLHVGYKPRPGA
jgi:demethylmenaquinone methyltransferase/2-methoxy-6-polyprenyl-1,4-benzoquinol methylase